MKTKSMLLASLAALALGATRGNGAEVSVSLFYDALEPHGEWIEAADYGYVWAPRGVDADWRPYTDGQWVYTDAGWTWVSEEPYSWAVYHYGRWVKLESVGWSWVPDTEWGPAWVSWRHSDKYVGWAPLPPESRETIRVGVNLGNWVDTYYDIGPASYCFVEVRNLGAPRLRAVVLPPRENITIINQTTNITNVTVRNNIVFNEGPDYNGIVRQTAQPIRRLKLERQVDIADAKAVRGDSFRTRIQGDSLAIPAPQIQAASAGLKPKKIARRVENVSVNRGWKDAGDAQKVEAYRNKLQAEAKPPANLPPVERRDRAERGAAGADRPTTRTDKEADTNNRPPGAAREGRTTGDASRPTAGTGRNPAEEPKRPTADTTAPSNDTRAPGANRPGMAKRMPGDASRPAASTGNETDRTRPPAATTDSTRPGAAPATENEKPDKSERSGAQRGNAQEKKQGERKGAAAEGALPPQRNADKPQPSQGDKPAVAPEGNRPGATERPKSADRAERPERPDRPERPQGAERPDRPSAAERLGNDRPEGARAGNPRADRPDRPERADRPEQPQGRGPAADRPGNAGNDRPGQSERAKPEPGAGAAPAPGQAGGAPGAGAKPGKGDGEKGKKEKKEGE